MLWEQHATIKEAVRPHRWQLLPTASNQRRPPGTSLAPRLKLIKGSRGLLCQIRCGLANSANNRCCTGGNCTRAVSAVFDVDRATQAWFEANELSAVVSEPTSRSGGATRRSPQHALPHGYFRKTSRDETLASAASAAPLQGMVSHHTLLVMLN